MGAMTLTVRPLTRARWRDLEMLMLVVAAALALACTTSGDGHGEAEPQPPPPDRPVQVRQKTQLEKLTEAIAPYVEKARATWPSVRARFLAGLPGGAVLFATVQLRDGAGRMEQVFVKVESIDRDIIRGLIWSDLHTVSGFAKGQRHEFPERELIDWTISNPDGTEEGNVVGTFLDTWNWSEH